MEVKDRAQYETMYQTQVSVLFDIRINYCMISVHIWSFSGPYSVQMQENTSQKNSKYGHFSRSKNDGCVYYVWWNNARIAF